MVEADAPTGSMRRHGTVRTAGRHAEPPRRSRTAGATGESRHGNSSSLTVQSVLVESLGFAASFFIRGPWGGRRGGVTGAAVPDGGPAAGPAVKMKSGSSTGLPAARVDQNRLGFDPGFAVDEHHAALVGSQARVAPRGERDDHGPRERPSSVQHVLVADRLGSGTGAVRASRCRRALESAGQQARGDAEVVLELVEVGCSRRTRREG